MATSILATRRHLPSLPDNCFAVDTSPYPKASALRRSLGPSYELTYTPTLDIRNLDSLPRGTGCPFLEVVLGIEPGVWIAKQWRRTIPVAIPGGNRIIRFKADGRAEQ